MWWRRNVRGSIWRKRSSPFKPEVVVPKAGGDREYWLIEGRAFAKNTNIGKDTPDEAREVSDIATRLAHMDELGVDVHILYPIDLPEATDAPA